MNRSIKKVIEMKFISGNILLLSTMSFLFVSVSLAEDITNFIGMSFVNIPAGKFEMGLKDRRRALMEVPDVKQDALMDELPMHTVVISNSFYMAKTEVTQHQWLQVMENKPGNDDLWLMKNWQDIPVSSVSWFMAERFVEEINKMDSSYKYRLPTEAEWEYVARSGSAELRPVEEDHLSEYAWYIDNSGDKAQQVATKKANAFGVHDMLGNVWEWVDDWYDKDIYKQESRRDPEGPQQGWSKVRRGGSYHCPVHLIRPGYRGANKPGMRYEVTGFRVVAEKR